MGAPYGNKFAVGNSGKPRKFTPDELEQKIVEYFQYVEDVNKQRKLKRFEGEKLKPYTISGICVFMDISIDTWAEYSKLNEYSEPIKRAKARVMNHIEEGLLSGSLNAIGAIFNLKNNFGWTDKQEVTINGSDNKLTEDEILAEIKQRKQTHDKTSE